MPAVGLALAVLPAAAFAAEDLVGVGSDAAEGAFVALWLVGWGLSAWAGLVTCLTVVALLRGAIAGRSTPWIEPVLVGASLGLVALAAVLQP